MLLVLTCVYFLIISVVNMIKSCDKIVFSRWTMYVSKVIIAKNSKYISDALPDDRIQQILRLIFNNQKINKMNKDKNIVRII